MEFYSLLFGLVYAVCAEDYYYAPGNVSRATLSGIEAYRSALTLDWLAAEDSRQRELVAAYETEASAPARLDITECNDYPKPSSGKVTKLMLELLKNLEGDEGVIVPELIRVLRRSRLLMENTALYAEPDLDSLMKMPSMMVGQSQVTIPRILAIVWIIVTDATTTKNNGWCPINKVNDYLEETKPAEIANHLTVLEPVIARARYIMEEFIQSITPTHNQRTSQAPFENQHIRITTTEATDTPETDTPATDTPAPATETRRARWKNAENKLKMDVQRQQSEFPPRMTEYQSTQFLEQAQHFGTMEKDDLTSTGTSNQFTKVICGFELVLFTLLF